MVEQGQAGNGLSGGMKLIIFASAKLAWWITSPIRAVVNDRHLAKAGVMGVVELGNTFGQMLPDSQTAREVGNVWNSGESAGPKRPSQIAMNNRTYDPGQSKSKEQGLAL